MEELINNRKARQLQHISHMAEYNMKVGTNNNSKTKVTLDDKKIGKLPEKYAINIGKLKDMDTKVGKVVEKVADPTPDPEKCDYQGKLKVSLDPEIDEKVGKNHGTDITDARNKDVFNYLKATREHIIMANDLAKFKQYSEENKNFYNKIANEFLNTQTKSKEKLDNDSKKFDKVLVQLK